MSKIEAIVARITSLSIVWFARFITAIHGIWIGIEPSPRQRIYFANHTSNGDFILALDENSSLIIFPEGLRNMTDVPVLPFKTGLFHLATKRPEVEMVPVWIENLNRMLPKGEIIPIPFGCTVTFGPPIKLQGGEDKQTFLNRAADAIRALVPENDGKGRGDE